MFELLRALSHSRRHGIPLIARWAWHQEHDCMVSTNLAVYVTRPLTRETWNDFAESWSRRTMASGAAVGVLAFTPKGFRREQPRSATSHSSASTWRRERCTRSWSTKEKSASAGASSDRLTSRTSTTQESTQGTSSRPNRRIGWCFTGSRHRGSGVYRAAVAGILGCHRHSWRRNRRGIPGAGGRPSPATRRRSFTRDPSRCSRSSASPETARSPSGAG